MEYVEAALQEFSAVEDHFQANTGFLIKHPNEIPKLETRIPIDKGEIRPDSIDDW